MKKFQSETCINQTFHLLAQLNKEINKSLQYHFCSKLKFNQQNSKEMKNNRNTCRVIVVKLIRHKFLYFSKAIRFYAKRGTERWY